jgi:hypothetical protein
MRRDRALYREAEALVEPIMLDHGGEILPRPGGVMTAHLKLGGGAQADPGQRRLESDAEAAETPPEAAIEIDETEVKPRRNADADPLGTHHGMRRLQMLSLVA